MELLNALYSLLQSSRANHRLKSKSESIGIAVPGNRSLVQFGLCVRFVSIAAQHHMPGARETRG